MRGFEGWQEIVNRICPGTVEDKRGWNYSLSCCNYYTFREIQAYGLKSGKIAEKYAIKAGKIQKYS
jgi:hypothetical protein